MLITLALGLISVGTVVYSRDAYFTKVKGINNDG